MRKVWNNPTISFETFEANEYVAACYEVKCDVDSDVYLDSNNNGRLDKASLFRPGDKLLGHNDPCGQTLLANDPSLKKGFDSKGNQIWLFTDSKNITHAVSSLTQNGSNHS